jgi:hypothetical protein
LARDEDVLDTCVLSALWPSPTLGWPDKTPELSRFYPTSTLVTGFDIIFFCVARMMMMGLHFMQNERLGAPLEEVVPFHDVYIHALVRDASGAKMSKSKGNVIDPLALIDDYGADALRFTLAAMAAQGRDIKLSTQRVEGYRNFATKLWNAARFAEMNGCATIAKVDPKAAKETLNRWIAHETARAAAEITEAIEAYRFNDAANAAYRFVWNIYCDWYLELAKPLLTGPDGAAKSETQAMVAWARDEILKWVQPFMPFITEELWAVTGKHDALLALNAWPAFVGLVDEKAEGEIGWVIDLVTAIRSVRAEMNITAAIPLVLAGASAETKARAERWAEFIKRLARVSEISSAPAAPQGSVQLVVRGETAALPLKGVIDIAAERARLTKEMQKADADIARVDAKLGNPNSCHAPEEVVEDKKGKSARKPSRARPRSRRRWSGSRARHDRSEQPARRRYARPHSQERQQDPVVRRRHAGAPRGSRHAGFDPRDDPLAGREQGLCVGLWRRHLRQEQGSRPSHRGDRSRFEIAERAIDVMPISRRTRQDDASGTLWSTAELWQRGPGHRSGGGEGRSHRSWRLATLDRGQPSNRKIVRFIQDQRSCCGGRHRLAPDGRCDRNCARRRGHRGYSGRGNAFCLRTLERRRARI